MAGATGRVGRPLVELLRARGHDVVPMSRSLGVDVITGDGLAEALEGVEAIVDVATGPSPEEGPATEFFTRATHNLQEFGAKAGVRQIVVVSIIATDKFESGYGAAKVAHEQAMLAGPLPARILRAAQFHELVGQLVEWGAQGDVSYVPKMRSQLVAASAVAEVAADLATGPEPAAGAPIVEVAGPREESLVDVATRLVAKRGDTVKIVGVSDPDGRAAEVYESGGMLPGPGAKLAGPTFDEWLATT
ncbi:MAG TPA: NAD(P)H-binding protein, partial [Gaiellales bacterium]|nr:NAD(P)H-binding protein [Gaiellales bacterium]